MYKQFPVPLLSESNVCEIACWLTTLLLLTELDHLLYIYVVKIKLGSPKAVYRSGGDNVVLGIAGSEAFDPHLRPPNPHPTPPPPPKEKQNRQNMARRPFVQQA